MRLLTRAKGGGCSGFEYTMDFTADAAGDKDRVFEYDDLTVIVDRRSYLFMVGTTLDFVDDLMESGFQFRNPNVTASCGCGKSVAF